MVTDSDETTPTTHGSFALFNIKDILIISASIIFIILLGTIIFSPISPIFNQVNPIDEPTLSYSVAIAFLEALAIIASVYVWGIHKLKLSWQDLGLKPTRRKWFISAIVVALVFIPLMGLIALAIQISLGMDIYNPQLEFLAPDNISPLGAFSMFLFGGLVVPFAEEIFFRGVLYQWFRSYWSAWISIPLNALIFGVLHGDISVAGATFIMGIILAWFYERSQSLWPSIIIHMINNSVKLLILYLLLALGLNIT